MAKKILRSFFIFYGIVSLIFICGLLISYFTTGEGSYRIWGAYDGQASIITWLDLNANGVKDLDEPPLSGVCIWADYLPHFYTVNTDNVCRYSPTTDENGEWGQFLPGGRCEDFYVTAIATEGYEPTTDMVSNSCSAQFGFVKNVSPVSKKLLTFNDFARQQQITALIKKIGVGLLVITIASLGTFWLEKKK